MRLRQPEFWHNLLKLRFHPVQSVRSLLKLVAGSRSSAGNAKPGPAGSPGTAAEASLPDRLFNGFRQFKGPIMLIISSQDLIAREFDEAVRANPAWSRLIASESCRRIEMADGDHTFSSAEQRLKIVTWAGAWLHSW
jgi:hypothetical protein